MATGTLTRGATTSITMVFRILCNSKRLGKTTPLRLMTIFIEHNIFIFTELSSRHFHR